MNTFKLEEPLIPAHLESTAYHSRFTKYNFGVLPQNRHTDRILNINSYSAGKFLFTGKFTNLLPLKKGRENRENIKRLRALITELGLERNSITSWRSGSRHCTLAPLFSPEHNIPVSSSRK